MSSGVVQMSSWSGRLFGAMIFDFNNDGNGAAAANTPLSRQWVESGSRRIFEVAVSADVSDFEHDSG